MNDTFVLFENAPYGDHERQRYDLILPEENAGERGLILFIHGGSWIHGDKAAYRDDLDFWAGKGFAAASVNYHYLAPDVHMDTLVSDIALAVFAIRRKAEAHGVKLGKALLTGASAGGHLSLLYAYSMAEISAIKPACVVDYCGPALLSDEKLLFTAPEHHPPMDQWIELFSNLTGIPFTLENWKAVIRELDRYSPVTYISDSSVPTILVYGMKDDVVPFSNAKALRDGLEAHGVEYVFLPMPEAGHGLEQPEIFEESKALFGLYAERFLR
ncbi:MAG: alpha/beta hydrolase [Ruminococcaceae bacterium]|jgi:acetyl esterase/lipase|nr:alpha/beta hydrolase [Oscillospiraceae bacterium]